MQRKGNFAFLALFLIILNIKILKQKVRVAFKRSLTQQRLPYVVIIRSAVIFFSSLLHLFDVQPVSTVYVLWRLQRKMPGDSAASQHSASHTRSCAVSDQSCTRPALTARLAALALGVWFKVEASGEKELRSVEDEKCVVFSDQDQLISGSPSAGSVLQQ